MRGGLLPCGKRHDVQLQDLRAQILLDVRGKTFFRARHRQMFLNFKFIFQIAFRKILSIFRNVLKNSETISVQLVLFRTFKVLTKNQNKLVTELG